VAVPSFRRPETLARKTLRLLDRAGLLGVTTVFVEASERDAYAEVASRWGVALGVGAPGMDGQMNAIRAAYPQGQPILQIDDDVDQLVVRRSPRVVVPLDDVAGFVGRAFDAMRNRRCSLWGLSPTANPFYMSNAIKVGLYFCDGTVHGFLNDRSPEFATTVPVKTDYERCLLAYARDGAVCRFDGVAFESRIYREPGGLQASGTRSLAAERAAVASLRRRWPDLVDVNAKRSRGEHLEIRLKTRRPRWLLAGAADGAVR
jgi:hypothetical protein